MRHMEALNAQTGPVLAAYPAAPETRRAARRSSRAARRRSTSSRTDGVRHSIWPVRDAGRDRADRRALRRDAGDLHRRRPSPLGGRLARGREPARGPAADGEPRVVPRRRLSASRAADPRLQPGGARPRRHDHRRAAREAAARSSSVTASDAAVRPARHGEFGLYAGGRWHRLALRPELAAARRPGRAARCEPADEPRAVAAARHRRSAHRQAHRLRRRRPRARRAGAARRFGRDGGRVLALSPRASTT